LNFINLGGHTMKRPRGWLSELDEANAVKMEQVVRAQWEKGADASEFTPHDPDHFARVEDWIRALVPQERWKDLSFEERKILTWCAWTHDIGTSLAAIDIYPWIANVRVASLTREGSGS
jgi:hypothetical protein